MPRSVPRLRQSAREWASKCMWMSSSLCEWGSLRMFLLDAALSCICGLLIVLPVRCLYVKRWAIVKQWQSEQQKIWSNWNVSMYQTEVKTYEFLGFSGFVPFLRYYHLILLDRIRKDIDKHKRLNFHLFQSLRKALFRPAAFFKGILLPLCEVRKCDNRCRGCAINGSRVYLFQFEICWCFSWFIHFRNSKIPIPFFS